MVNERTKANLLTFLFKCFVILWSLGNIFLVARLFFRNQLFVSAAGKMVNISDFVLLYEAGQLAGSADRLRVYDPQVLISWMNHFTQPVVCGQLFFIFQVPFVFPLLVLLGKLPVKAAYVVWVLLGLAAAGGACLYLLRRIKKCSMQYSLVFAFAVLSTVPALQAIELGQVSWLLVALLSGFFVFTWIKPRSWLAGLMLALFTIKPQYAIFMIAPLIACRKWAVLAWTALWEAGLLTLAGCTIGWNNVVHYPAIIGSMEASKNAMADKMSCLHAVLAWILNEPAAAHVAFILMIVAIVFAAALSYKWLAPLYRKDESLSGGAALSRISWTITINIIICLLTSPHTFLHDWVLMVPGAILTITVCRLPELFEIKPISSRIWTVSLIVYPVLSALMFSLLTFVPTLPVFIAVHAWLLFCALKTGHDEVHSRPNEAQAAV